MRKEGIETDCRYHNGNMSSGEVEKLDRISWVIRRMVSGSLPITLGIMSSSKHKSDTRIGPLGKYGIDSRTRERTR